MIVNKKQLADAFEVSTRTITEWQNQGCPVLSGSSSGGNGGENTYHMKSVFDWYAQREADIENGKLRKEVEDLRAAGESNLEVGTIDYERYRLTKAQADAQELKNLRDEGKVIDTEFACHALSRVANDIAAILDGIPLSMQRSFVDMDKRQLDHLKTLIAKAMNKAVETANKIPEMADEWIASREQ